MTERVIDYTITEQQLRAEAVAGFSCPTCDARAGRPCRCMSTEWTGKRRLWKQAPLHPERLALARERLLLAFRRHIADVG
jgi:hypothetical protein